MPRAATKLTKSKLDKLRAQATADPAFVAYVADAGQPGLYIWARRGRVRFVFYYSPPSGGRRRTMAIDDYGAITLEAARQIATSYRAQVAAGIDPQVVREEQTRRSISLEKAAEGYLEDLAERAKHGTRRGKRSSHAAMKRLLESNVLPRLGSIGIAELSADDVRRLHRGMSRTPVEANRTLGALSAVYGWAERAEMVSAGTNPTRHVERFAETGIRRAFTTSELQALGIALREAEEAKSIHPSAILAIRLLALTGFRRAEILGQALTSRRGEREGLRWSDVDLDSGFIRLRDSKTGPQTRTIGAAAVELLRKAQPGSRARNHCVCPGKVRTQPFAGIDKVRGKLWAAASIEGVDLHSLRHSFASIGAHVDGGRFAGHVSALLGHGYQSRAITERYITHDPEALRPAADAIGTEVARLLGLGVGSRIASAHDRSPRRRGAASSGDEPNHPTAGRLTSPTR